MMTWAQMKSCDREIQRPVQIRSHTISFLIPFDELNHHEATAQARLPASSPQCSNRICLPGCSIRWPKRKHCWRVKSPYLCLVGARDNLRWPLLLGLCMPDRDSEQRYPKSDPSVTINAKNAPPAARNLPRFPPARLINVLTFSHAALRRASRANTR